jgi:hypothetical protein
MDANVLQNIEGPLIRRLGHPIGDPNFGRPQQPPPSLCDRPYITASVVLAARHLRGKSICRQCLPAMSAKPRLLIARRIPPAVAERARGEFDEKFVRWQSKKIAKKQRKFSIGKPTF